MTVNNKEGAAIVVKRAPPVNLLEQETPYFRKDFEVRIPPPHIRVLVRLVVTAEGVLFKGGRIILESFSQPGNYAQWKRRSVIKTHLQHLFRKRSKRERAVWVTDDWSLGYFHWLSDVVPKMVIARREIEEFGLLLPAGFGNSTLVTETLSMLQIRNFNFVPAGEAVEVEELYYPIHTPISGDFNEQIMRDVRQRFRAVARSNSNTQRVYISRRRADKRRIINEKEIVGSLKDLRFTIIEAEELSFRQQIDLFSGCHYLVSIHGAGLTNMLFMPTGAKILELRKRDPGVPNCFFSLASALDLDYYYQFCSEINPEELAHSADLLVDRSEFRRDLEEMLRR